MLQKLPSLGSNKPSRDTTDNNANNSTSHHIHNVPLHDPLNTSVHTDAYGKSKYILVYIGRDTGLQVAKGFSIVSYVGQVDVLQ